MSSPPAARADTAAADGCAPGILSLTEILAISPDAAGQTAALDLDCSTSCGPAWRRGASGPGEPAQPPSVAAPLNPMLARSGGAARFVVVEKTDPLDATAISRVQQLQKDLPALGRSAGLTAARFELAGQTALTGDSIGSVFADLGAVSRWPSCW